MNSNHVELWDNCLKIIRDNIPEEQYNTWFLPIKSLGFDGKKLTLHVPSSFFVEKIEATYLPLLSKVLGKVYGGNIGLFYSYECINNQTDSTIEVMQPKDSAFINNRAKQQYPDIDPRLNSRYTFGNYCESNSNKLALSIGEAIATKPDCKTFNPLLIFGPVGAGKTHLIQAIGIKIKESNPSSRVLYLTAREFESQYTSAVTQNKINDFINFYQSVDVLIMDDIQELSGKAQTQNTFYHIFNNLHQNKKQLILSSDCRPADLDGFMPRLMSRFKWGVTAELSAPDYALRRTVVEKRAKEEGLDIPADVLDFIAENVTDSVRELEGIILSLITRATYLNQKISIDIARVVISNAVKISKKAITFEYIAEVVSAHYGIESDLIYGKTRKREISDAREVVMYLAKKFTKLSTPMIGRKLQRTHATVLHACKTIEGRISVEKQIQDDIAAIEMELRK